MVDGRNAGAAFLVTLWLLILCPSGGQTAVSWGTFTPALQTPPTVTASINENSVAGTSVLTIAATGTSVTYSITAATGSDSASKISAFAVDSSTGAVTVASATPLDRETIQYVDLTVVATDTTPSSVTATVRVGLNDVNEVAPTFTPASGVYSATILESATVSSVVQTLTVTDTDSAATAVTCSITAGDTTSKFQMRVDGKTIELKALIEPDLPTSESLTYTLTVICTDNNAGTYSGGILTSTGTVSVTVTPVNDNTPVWGTFTPAWSSGTTAIKTIDENLASGTIFTMTATDNDVGSDGTVVFSIVSAKFDGGATTASALFTVGATTGVVARTAATTPAIDRETFSYIEFVVQAIDSAAVVANQLSTTRTVRVDIKDVNEFAPTFTPVSGVYSTTIPETATVGYLVQTLTVADTDSAATAVTCAITAGDPHSKFQVRADGKTIELKTVIVPDLPTSDPLTYTLTVACSDNTALFYSGGSLTSAGTVTVTVSPVNTYTPSWGTFSPAWSSATTAITIIDENLSSGTIFTAAATDNDVGSDGTLVYSITSIKFSDGTTDASGLFTIGSSSGAVTRTVTASTMINREVYSYIDYILEVRDSSTNPADRKTATRSVRVDIKDVNEFDPVFTPASGQYSLSFSETSPVGYLVLNVPVSDPDASVTPIICTITSGNSLDRYQMRADGTSIELKTQVEPDSPTLDPVNFVLLLDCADNNAGTYTGGKRTSTATVSVSILYNNDYSPVWSAFTPPWSSATTAITTIIENYAVNNTVFTAYATDSDTGVDGLVVYSIYSATPATGPSVMAAFYIVSSTGAVKIANSSILDRETYGYVDLVINARDSPTSGTTYTITQTVRVALSDYNEFRPVFTPTSGLYTPAFPETSASGTAVQTIVAVDPDYDNTAIVCDISGGNSLGKFTVNSANKKLVETTAVIQPDKPTLDPNAYLLTMICADMNNGTVGTPILTSTAYITVTVNLVNDYDPTITLNSTTMTIPEDTSVSSVIVSVTADDLDYGNDGVFTLTLNPTTPFGLTGDRTKLLLTQSLDRETQDTYTIRLISVDQGSPSRSATTTLTVSVTDVNDNTPVCTPSFYNTSVSANTATTLLASISCTDPDLGANSLLAYSFISGDTRNLTLSSTNGALSTTFLTYESSAPYKTLLIAVRDSATPASAQRTTTVTVSVFVLPRNLGAPVWGSFSPAWTSSSTAITLLSERADEGYAVFTAVATDGDSGPDGQVIYSLASVVASDGSTDLSSVFNISSSTGEVKVKTYGVLDREAASAYSYVNFVVQARDNPTSTTPNTITRTLR